MKQIDIIKKNIETLREQLNKLIENGEKGAKVLMVSQQLDELVLEYYKYINANSAIK